MNALALIDACIVGVRREMFLSEKQEARLRASIETEAKRAIDALTIRLAFQCGHPGCPLLPSKDAR